jgi:uncharacterized protein
MNSIFLINEVERVLFQAGLSLYETRLDKDWGLTDCISFMVMQRE